MHKTTFYFLAASLSLFFQSLFYVLNAQHVAAGLLIPIASLLSIKFLFETKSLPSKPTKRCESEPELPKPKIRSPMAGWSNRHCLYKEDARPAEKRPVNNVLLPRPLFLLLKMQLEVNIPRGKISFCTTKWPTLERSLKVDVFSCYSCRTQVVQAGGLLAPSSARFSNKHRWHSFMLLVSLLSYLMLVATPGRRESMQTAERAGDLDQDFRLRCTQAVYACVPVHQCWNKRPGHWGNVSSLTRTRTISDSCVHYGFCLRLFSLGTSSAGCFSFPNSLSALHVCARCLPAADVNRRSHCPGTMSLLFFFLQSKQALNSPQNNFKKKGKHQQPDKISSQSIVDQSTALHASNICTRQGPSTWQRHDFLSNRNFRSYLFTRTCGCRRLLAMVRWSGKFVSPLPLPKPKAPPLLAISVCHSKETKRSFRETTNLLLQKNIAAEKRKNVDWKEKVFVHELLNVFDKHHMQYESRQCHRIGDRRKH